MLKEPEQGPTAVQSLLAWAAVEAGNLGVDPWPLERAQEAAGALADDAAVLELLDLDDPENEMPAELEGVRTPYQACVAMAKLAEAMLRRAD